VIYKKFAVFCFSVSSFQSLSGTQDATEYFFEAMRTRSLLFNESWDSHAISWHRQLLF